MRSQLPTRNLFDRIIGWIFTVRCYASAVCAVFMCPSVCLSVYHKPALYPNDPKNLAVFLAWRLPSTYPTLFCKEIWVHLKNKDTSLWNSNISHHHFSAIIQVNLR